MHIKIWRYKDAPKKYKFDEGGDEDWVALIPEDFPDATPMWMQEGTSFGCCTVSEHEVKGGTVYVGAHG